MKGFAIVLGLFFVLPTLVGAAYLSYFFYKTENPITAINVKSHPFLPHSASEITYSESSMRIDYKFKISEYDFTDWVSKKKFINRGYLQNDGTYLPNTGPSIRTTLPGLENKDLEITDGIWITNLDVDGGGYIIVYDRINKIGYYNWSAN
jgi:hypothetical protein